MKLKNLLTLFIIISTLQVTFNQTFFSKEEDEQRDVDYRSLVSTSKTPPTGSKYVGSLRRYWKDNTPFEDSDKYGAPQEGTKRIKSEESEEEVLQPRKKQVYKKPFIDTEEDDDKRMVETTQKPFMEYMKQLKLHIRKYSSKLQDHHRDYPDSLAEVGKNRMRVVPTVNIEVTKPVTKHRHRKKPRRIIFIDPEESIEIIRKSHNKRRPPQDYENQSDEYYDDVVTPASASRTGSSELYKA